LETPRTQEVFSCATTMASREVKNGFIAAFSVSSETDPANLFSGGFKKGK